MSKPKKPKEKPESGKRTSANLQRICAKHGVTQSDFIRVFRAKTGKGSNYADQLWRGDRGIGPKTVKIVIEVLADFGIIITRNDIMMDSEAIQRTEKLIPVFIMDSAKSFLKIDDRGKAMVDPDSRAPAETRDPNAFWVAAHLDTMTGGDIRVGDKLLIEPHRKNQNGCLVFVRNHTSVYVKKYFEADNSITLSSLTLEIPPIVIPKKKLKDWLILRVSKIEREV